MMLFLKRYWAPILALIAVAFLLWYVYDAGYDKAHGECEADKAKQRALIAELKTKQGTVTTKVETVYVDRVKTITEKGDVVVKNVPVYIPADSCALPVGYRLLHDAAAKGTVPDSLDGVDG